METRELIHDQVTDQLRRMIETNRSTRLVRLGSERILASDLGVSRLSLRTAIKALVDEGLLIQKPGSGTYILPKPRLETLHLLLAPDIKPADPFYQGFIAAFSRVLSREGMDLAIVDPYRIPSTRTDSPLVLVGLAPQTMVLEIRERYRYIVSTQSYPDSLDITQVFFDDYRVGQQAGSVLQEHNHERLIHLCGPHTYQSASERRRGFMDSLVSPGVTAEVIEGKMNWSSGYEMGGEVYKLVRGPYHASAVFVANDWMALGMLNRLSELGIRVPEELSVIGCDDIHLANEFRPALSTFRLDVDFQALEVFLVLSSLLYSEASRHKRVLLPAEFVDRASLIVRGHG